MDSDKKPTFLDNFIKPSLACHDITEILLKVALNTITPSIKFSRLYYRWEHKISWIQFQWNLSDQVIQLHASFNRNLISS